MVDGVRQAELSHIDVNKPRKEITLNFNGPVNVSSVSNGKDTLVELRAAGSGQHTSRDDWHPQWRWTRVVVTRLCIPWRFSGRARKRDRLAFPWTQDHL